MLTFEAKGAYEAKLLPKGKGIGLPYKKE